MTRALPAALVLIAATAAAQYVPPVLKGVQGEGSGRRSLAPIPFPDAKEKWVLAKSKHFVFVSSAPEGRTRDVAQGLETLAAALMHVSPHFTAASAETRVFVFEKHSEAQPYFDMLVGMKNANVSGIFISSKNDGAMLIENKYGPENRTPFHELIHYLIASSGTRPPLWLEEGMGEYFSNATFRNGSIRAGAPIVAHLQLLRTRRLIPLEQLFTITDESELYKGAETQRAFYAESWGIVEWLIRTNPAAFYDFLHDVENGKSVEEALRVRYERSIGDMQRSFETLIITPWRTTMLDIPNVDASVTIAPLDRAELLYRLGRFLAQVDDVNGDSVRHFREALVVNPKHARSLAAIGEYDKAIAADPNDAEIYLEYAETFLDKQVGPLAEAEATTDDDVKPFRKARELAQKAVLLRPGDGRAWGDLGTSYIVEKDLSPGILALEKARELAPGRLDYAVHLFAMYRRTGDRAKADALFTELDRARNPQVSYALRATSLRGEMARAQELLNQQKLDEAAAVIRDLAATIEDADARKDLTSQADELTHTAATNRQIESYNKAVGEVNRGDYKQALKTLDQLLKDATDPGVIKDATKLRAQLIVRKGT